MTVRRAPILALLALAACHRGGTADVTVDADETAANATAVKTLEDIAAADAAARRPLPPREASEPHRSPPEATARPPSAPAEESDRAPVDLLPSSADNATAPQE